MRLHQGNLRLIDDWLFFFFFCFFFFVVVQLFLCADRSDIDTMSRDFRSPVGTIRRGELMESLG